MKGFRTILKIFWGFDLFYQQYGTFSLEGTKKGGFQYFQVYDILGARFFAYVPHVAEGVKVEGEGANVVDEH